MAAPLSSAARAIVSAALGAATIASGFTGCSSSRDHDPVPALPASAQADVPLTLRRRFPSDAHPGVRTRGCLFASPLAIDDAGARRIVVADGGGKITALDPATGDEAWSVDLPAPPGERAFVVATPVVVGRRLVVAYHTIAADAPRLTVVVPRLRHRVAAIDLDAHAPAADLPAFDLAPVVHGRFGDFSLDASHAMARGALVLAAPAGAKNGRVYVTFGNVRDLQPYRGWIVEVDVDAWRAKGPAAAVSAARSPVEDVDCGPEDGDGAKSDRCGAGVWSPSGPLVLPTANGGYDLVVPTGNGQLDPSRGDFGNTLMRMGPGLAFDHGCDPDACRTFGTDTLASSCVETCGRLFIPRLLPGEQPIVPASGECNGLGLWACWIEQDQLDGGSTPVALTLPSGRRVLVYPTKDGHLWLVDAEHMGTVYAHEKLTEPCGAPGDDCAMPWAGTVVTKPAVTTIDGAPAVIVPTFVADATHPAGVVALRVVEDGAAPRFAPAWQLPPFDDVSATKWFRRHPSRVTLATPAGAEEHAFVVDVTAPDDSGRLLAIRARDGKVAGQAALAGPGYRFTSPLFEGGAIFVNSCDSDAGPGFLEAFDVSR